MFNWIRFRWRATLLGRASRVLTRDERLKVLFIALLQITFGLLDLIGIAAVGILGALALSGVNSSQPGDRVGAAIRFLGLSDFPLQVQSAVIATIAAIILISKTIFSIIFTRKIVFFLSRRGASISTLLIDKLLSKSLLVVQSKPYQETVYALTAGVEAITIGVLNTTILIIADISLLVLLLIGLFIVDPTVAISTFILFGSIGLLLNKIMHARARELSAKQARLGIKTNQKILEVLNSYREAVVSNRRNYYARKIGEIRLSMANTTAELTFMPNVGKYVIEMTVVLGSLLIAAAQFLLHTASHAAAVMGIFYASSMRIAPAVLRLQQSVIGIRRSVGSAESTLQMVDNLVSTDSTIPVSDILNSSHQGFIPKVELQNLTFTYPGKISPAVSNFTLSIEPGLAVAIVGASGSGKTSVVDLMLGVLNPDFGEIKISGESPLVAVAKWPGSVAYVPQDIVITNGSIKENIGIGYPLDQIPDVAFWDALKIANLDKFVQSLPEGINTYLADRGAGISGGQRQRLGIARAMITNPKLIVLDEATSSLDGDTEAQVSSAINNLKGDVTVILIAHRLSTVLQADIVVYMNSGKIEAVGSFQEVRERVPDFDRQAELMGL